MIDPTLQVTILSALVAVLCVGRVIDWISVRRELKTMEDLPRRAGHEAAGTVLAYSGFKYRRDGQVKEAFFDLCEALKHLSNSDNKRLRRKVESEIYTIATENNESLLPTNDQMEHFADCIDTIVDVFSDKKHSLEIKKKFNP